MKQRGISTIIGGVIFLVLLTAGFSSFFVAMDVQSDTVNAHRAVSNLIIEKTREDFVIEVTSDASTGYKLEIQAKNQGPNPVQISNIWIINKSEVNEPATSYDVNYDDAFITPGDETQILEKTPIKMKHGEHDIKVVSVLGSIVIEKKFDPGNPGGSGEEIILKDELFGKPSVLSIFPGPSGIDSDDDSKGVWGVMVANPTDQPLEVSKVVIIAFSANPTSGDTTFSLNCRSGVSDPLKVETIFPTVHRWECPRPNQLVWSDVNNPITVQPRSVHPFLAKIGLGNTATGEADTSNILIQSVVFTSLGQFGKSSYATTVSEKNIAMPNVFLSKTDNQGDAADNGNILGNITRITEGTQVVFNATLVDMSDNDNPGGINIGSKLIVNLPKDWIFNGPVCPTCHPGFVEPITSVTYPDGSTQIVGVLEDFIDDGDDEAAIIKFYATAPAVTSTKMYVMHILAHGTATGDASGSPFPIGPLAEIVLQVCPTTGCLP